ncbi:MAG: serine/threonine-protein phosphatase 6 regulatory ankyrin repeat subunit B-like [Candidatus Midichloriaceae bacterium]|jgi:ankyrin repeat protein|nr:serine/threonine-protein phosphatase 6 regulatory ankyrin repeat subunit B-like [Candidatus Midichloriaceae bacterium]
MKDKLNKDLINAAKSGNIQEVIDYLNAGAEVNAKNEGDATPLHYACSGGHTNIVKLLLEKKAEVNAKNVGDATPLHWAALAGHINIVESLLEKGAEVDAKAAYNRTPLHWAAQVQDIKTMLLLISHGADAQIRDKSGSTAYDHLTYKNRFLYYCSLYPKTSMLVAASTAICTAALYFSEYGHSLVSNIGEKLVRNV